MAPAAVVRSKYPTNVYAAVRLLVLAAVTIIVNHSEAGAACADYRQQEPRNIAQRSDLATEMGFNPGPLTSPAGRVLKYCKQRAFELIVAIHYRGLIQVAHTCTSANLCLACTNKADLCMLCAAYLYHADIIQGENLDVNG